MPTRPAHDPEHRFDLASEAYDRVRPGYPPEAVAWTLERAGVGSGDRVLDLGAGTGLLADRIAAHDVELVAAEPNALMRARLAERLPSARVLDARAEATGLEDGAAALVTAGQAYHWFDPGPALAEIHRVLRPGGHLAVVWIVADRSDPLQRRIESFAWPLLARHADHPGPLPHQPLGWEEHFSEVATAEFPFTRAMRGTDIPAYVGSFSVVANLEPDERRRALEKAAGWVEPERVVTLPYSARVHLGRRL